MSKPVALSTDEHKDLKVDNRPAPEHGDSVNRAQVFTTEFGELHKEFPILFHKDSETGDYQAHVILGFDAEENLFLGEDEWLSNYVPAIFARGPFLMGTRESKGGDQEMDPVILIDTDDPRVGAADGEAVFTATGLNSPYLESVLRSLRLIHSGAALNKTFFSTLESMDLLEPVSIKVTLSNIEQVELHSYYTINEEKLAQLDGSSLKQLNSLDILELVYFMLSSLGNMRNLIEMKNRKAALA